MPADYVPNLVLAVVVPDVEPMLAGLVAAWPTEVGLGDCSSSLVSVLAVNVVPTRVVLVAAWPIQAGLGYCSPSPAPDYSYHADCHMLLHCLSSRMMN